MIALLLLAASPSPTPALPHFEACLDKEVQKCPDRNLSWEGKTNLTPHEREVFLCRVEAILKCKKEALPKDL